MTIFEKILAGLQQKFPGVDTATLTRIATKKAEGVTDETKVNSIVEGISFSDVPRLTYFRFLSFVTLSIRGDSLLLSNLDL